MRRSSALSALLLGSAVFMLLPSRPKKTKASSSSTALTCLSQKRAAEREEFLKNWRRQSTVDARSYFVERPAQNLVGAIHGIAESLLLALEQAECRGKCP